MRKSAFTYLCKSNMLFDLRDGGESFNDALARLDLPVLMIIDESDQLFTRNQAEEARSALPPGEVAYYNSGNGHLSCIYETHHIEYSILEFMNRSTRGMSLTVRESLRNIDIITRTGEDEFVILLPETALEYAIHVAQRVSENTQGLLNRGHSEELYSHKRQRLGALLR